MRIDAENKKLILLLYHILLLKTKKKLTKSQINNKIIKNKLILILGHSGDMSRDI